MKAAYLLSLALGLTSCGKSSYKQVSIEAVQGYEWVSQEYKLSLVVTPAEFIFTSGQRRPTHTAYRVLANQQILLGNDTIALHVKRNRELSLQPISRRLIGGESIAVVYAATFLKRE